MVRIRKPFLVHTDETGGVLHFLLFFPMLLYVCTFLNGVVNITAPKTPGDERGVQ